MICSNTYEEKKETGSWWKINTSHGVQRGHFINRGNSHWSLLYFKLMKNRCCSRLAGMAACLRWSEEHTGSYFGLKNRRAAWQFLSPAEVWDTRRWATAGVDQIPTVSSSLCGFTPTDCPSTCLSESSPQYWVLFEASPHLLWHLPACWGESSERTDWTDV